MRPADGSSVASLAVLLAGLLLGTTVSAQPGSFHAQAETDGLAIALSLDSTAAGEPARIGLQVNDARTGLPVPGARPHAWLLARRSEAVASETSCAEKIRALISGALSARADLDLNSYTLAVLNDDTTVAFINPQVAFGPSKLESLLTLPGQVASWALSPRGERLLAAIPSQNALFVIDTVSRRLQHTIPLSASPGPLAWQPDGKRLWAGLNGSSALSALDTGGEKSLEVEAGPPPHSVFSFSADSRFLAVSSGSGDAGEISLIDTRRMTMIANVPVGGTVSALAFSRAAGQFYAAAETGHSILALDPTRPGAPQRIAAAEGATVLAFEPEGRFGLVLRRHSGTLSVLDTASDTEIGTTRLSMAAPDQIAFSRRFAYVRGARDASIALIDLAQLRQGKLAPVDVPVGTPAPSDHEGTSHTSLLAPTPDGDAMLIASGADRAVLYYAEGMMAPSGSFQTYGRVPRGLLVLDRSLTETEPGRWSATTLLPSRAGQFDVPVLIDRPRLLHCFTLELSGGARQALPTRRRLVAKPLFGPSAPAARESVELRFRITDEGSGREMTGLSNARLLVMRPPGTWQLHNVLREVGEGVYAARVTFPDPGVYELLINPGGLQYLSPTELRVGSSDEPARTTAP